LADLILPTWLVAAKVSIRYLANVGVAPATYTGMVRTAAYGGDRLAASLDLGPFSSSDSSSAVKRAALMSVMAALRGKANRIYLTDPARKLRGSFPATELLSNHNFANGAAGWTVNYGTLTVADRVMRHTFSGNTGNPSFYQDPSIIQNVPYAARVQVNGIRSAAALTAGVFINNNIYSDTIASYVSQGLATAVFVATGATGVRNGFYALVSSGTVTAGGFFEVPWCSLSRCALVDNRPNLLLQSQDLFTTWTQVGLSAPTANNTDTAPDGALSAETISENAAAGSHYLAQSVTVSSAAADYSLSCYFKASSRSWAYLQLVEASGSSSVVAWINLSNGSLGTTAITGGNWSNLRAPVPESVGNGWFRLTITARKTNAATSLQARLGITTGDNVTDYTGASLSIAAWGASLAQSSVPIRYVATTTGAAAAVSQTGSVIHTKGWPESTNSLLLPGDQVEIITSRGSELKIITAPVNSDAAGLAYMQFEPPLRGAVADNAAIVIHEPMGRFIVKSDPLGWDNEPGVLTRSSIELEEAA
jgi:hypothetical protein